MNKLLKNTHIPAFFFKLEVLIDFFKTLDIAADDFLFTDCAGNGRAKVGLSHLIYQLQLSQMYQLEKQKGYLDLCQSASDLKHHFNR